MCGYRGYIEVSIEIRGMGIHRDIEVSIGVKAFIGV